MLPNSGLYSYNSLLSLYECFLKDPAFEEIMERPYTLKVESFKWDNVPKQFPSILRCISAASLEQVMKIYNVFRSEEVKHWSTEQLENDTYQGLINSINNSTGVCTGMSMTWIEGILKYNLPLTSRPSLYLSVLYQDLLKDVSFEETQGIAKYTSKSSPSRFDLLSETWLDADNHEYTGYIFSMFPVAEDEDGEIGHSCAFLKIGRTGYIMLPNAGLYSFKSLLSFNECFLKDPSFRKMEESPYFIVAESYKWE